MDYAMKENPNNIVTHTFGKIKDILETIYLNNDEITVTDKNDNVISSKKCDNVIVNGDELIIDNEIYLIKES